MYRDNGPREATASVSQRRRTSTCGTIALLSLKVIHPFAVVDSQMKGYAMGSPSLQMDIRWDVLRTVLRRPPFPLLCFLYSEHYSLGRTIIRLRTLLHTRTGRREYLQFRPIENRLCLGARSSLHHAE